MESLSFGLAALYVAIAAWVYFDAVEHGRRYAAGWGLLLLALGWLFLLPVLIYFLVRNSGRHVEPAKGAATRQYLVTASFGALVLTVTGASWAIGAAVAPSNFSTTSDYRDALASAIAACVVGSILWISHWKIMNRRVATRERDDEFRAIYALRVTEVLTAAFVLGFVTVTSGLLLLGGAVSAAAQASYAASANWLPALGPFLVSGAAAAYHVQFHRAQSRTALAARFASIPAPLPIEPPRYAAAGYAPAPVPPPRTPPPSYQAWPTPAAGVVSGPTVGTAAAALPTTAQGARREGKFCTHCGKGHDPEDAFCSACGAALVHSRSDQKSQPVG